jgi:predicted Zn-dependent protease
MDMIAALTDILSRTPEDAFARYGLAMAYIREGRQPEALAEFDAILERTPDYVPAYQMSAQELLKGGNTEAARTRLLAGLLAADRTGNTHAASEMQAMLDDLG